MFNISTFIINNKDLLLILLTTSTLIVTIYFNYKNLHSSRKSNTLANSKLLLQNFYSPLYLNQFTLYYIFDDPDLKDFFLLNSFLLDKHTFIILEEIYKTENELKSNRKASKELLEKHKLTKAALFSNVKLLYNDYKNIYSHESLTFTNSMFLPTKIRLLLFITIIIFISFFIINLFITYGFYFFFNSIFLLNFLILIYCISIILKTNPHLSINYPYVKNIFFRYSSYSYSRIDAVFYCKYCNKYFTIYKGLNIKCSSKHKWRPIFFYRLENKLIFFKHKIKV